MPEASALSNWLLALVSGLLACVLAMAWWHFRTLVMRMDQFSGEVARALSSLRDDVAAVSKDVAVLQAGIIGSMETRLASVEREVGNLREWVREHNNLHQRHEPNGGD